MEDAPRVIIIAGPNGAGKTTFACEFLPHEADCPVFVNADQIAAGLASAGIGTLVHYPIAPHLQQAYAGKAPIRGSLSVAERLQSEVLSLPIGSTMTLADVDRVADCICEELSESTT
jgi:dTDP-4-amino-4,6-dideoxygalactose transaminase